MKPSFRSVTCVLAMSALFIGPLAAVVPGAGDLVALAKGNDGDKGGGNGGGNGGGRDRGGDEARGGNGNGNGHGNAGGRARGNATGDETAVAVAGEAPAPRNHGAIASGLKGLNAAHASPQALANAAPNSQVGRIAIYKAAVEDSAAAAAAQAELDALLAGRAEADLAFATASADLAQRLSGQQGAADLIAADLDALRNDGIDDATQPEIAGLEGQLAAVTAEAMATQAEIDALAAQHATDTADLDARAAELALAAAYAGPTPEGALLEAARGRSLSFEELSYLHELLGLEPPVAAETAPDPSTSDAGAAAPGTAPVLQ